MADQLGRSVGDMYEGAFIPGLVLAAMYATFVAGVSFLFPKAAPGLPVEDIGYREADGARGVWQLGVLALYSAVVAIFEMKQTDVRAGADFVVLTMSIGVVVSFLCAVFNRLLGARLVMITGVVLLLLVAASYYLHEHNHPNWALLVEALAAGALYAFVAGALERTTGFRL